MQAANYYSSRFQSFVPNAKYEANVDPASGFATIDIPAPAAAAATAFSSAVAMVNGSAVTVNYSNSQGVIAEKYGRSLALVASTTNTRTGTITGRDFMGQPITETFTMNSGTIVETVKTYKKVDKVVFDTASDTTTVNIGTGTRLGIPYKAIKLITELANGVIPTGGALTAGVDTQTASSSDPRGYYVPHSSVTPNGARAYTLTIQGDLTKIRGSAHYSA